MNGAAPLWETMPDSVENWRSPVDMRAIPERVSAPQTYSYESHFGCPVMMTRRTWTLDLLASKCDVTPAGCWEWSMSRSLVGYGRACVDGGYTGAHRLAWSLANGRPVPDGMYVLHACDNRPCCNPEHLWIGTAADNTRDMFAKGRNGYTGVRGDRNPKAKLDADKVRAIRRSTAPHSALAPQFGVSISLIRAVRIGAAWGWVV